MMIMTRARHSFTRLGVAIYIRASLPLACERLGSHLPVSPACADTYTCQGGPVSRDHIISGRGFGTRRLSTFISCNVRGIRYTLRTPYDFDPQKIRRRACFSSRAASGQRGAKWPRTGAGPSTLSSCCPARRPPPSLPLLDACTAYLGQRYR